MMMKRTTAWLISLVGAIVVTYILFEFTPIAIPFFEGGPFTILTILLFAVLFVIPLDRMIGAQIFDEHGWHLGPVDPMGPLVGDREDESEGEPIVSRDERKKLSA